MQSAIKNNSTINWNQVSSLIALNAAVVISWIAYHNYQPKVLELFHFQELALFLVVAQAIILVLIPPIAGLIGDYFIKSNGNRFIVFTVGTSVTAMTFMCVAFTVGTANTINLTSALPFMIVIWLISMNIFHSPANSMMELFASGKNLPVAMAFMTLTTELLYALEPVVVWFVDLIGPVSTFALGGVLLIVTGYFFRKTTLTLELKREYEETKAARETNLPLVISVALLMGLTTAIIMNLLPTILVVKLEPMSHTALGGAHFVSFILGIAAIAALPLLSIVGKLGIKNALVTGMVVVFIGIVGVFTAPEMYSTIFACIILALGYSLMSIAAFPFALQHIATRYVTLGAGIFFGCLELADGLMNIFSAL